ncbi:MAG: efflux RND transporter periplasmic adaptor subunit [Candidatus Binatia bacterium]
MLRAFVVAIVSALLSAACSGGGADGKPAGTMPPVFVETMVMKPSAIRDVAELVGQLEAEESVDLRAEIRGIIEEVAFEEGTRVEAAALLFRLRDSEQAAELAAAEARERLAADTHRRFRELAEQEVTSRWELERVSRELDVARAEVARARVRLAKTRIRAPFAGKLGARKVSPGDTIDSDTMLVDIHATERLRLALAVPERFAPVARVGIPLEVAVAAYPGEWFRGEVYFVAPAVDAANRQLSLKAIVQNSDGRLWPGQFAEIRTELTRRDEALVVPDSALVYEGQTSFVWRVGDDRKAERVDVEVGIHGEGKIELRKGVAVGDEVVVAGTNKLFPGAMIATDPPPASASAPAEAGRGS